MNPQSAASADLMAAALGYARRGLPVFPCKVDKKPFPKSGFKEASTDPTQIEAWWKEHPNALIGIKTGVDSDLYVIDVDIKHVDGFPAFKKMPRRSKGSGWQ
ncbi:MAG TPA: bifunctional DNA primase/polymerase [Methylocella sp.]|jgi:hypothetical protein|nr:bifunctional DNA primase/polymerase [Methylocella sp.]